MVQLFIEFYMRSYKKICIQKRQSYSATSVPFHVEVSMKEALESQLKVVKIGFKKMWRGDTCAGYDFFQFAS